jgi:hypothetical protein
VSSVRNAVIGWVVLKKIATILLLSLTGFAITAHSAAPRLYRQPANESPVRGDPDDLLMLAGYGFSADDVVVYQAVADTSKALSPPAQVPTQSATDTGVAPIVSVANVPDSLTIKLPGDLRVGQTYALWVRTSVGEWSAAVMINDARPLWISPAYVYATRSVGNLAREIKIVGRNLQPIPGGTTRIRLAGPEVVTGVAIVDAQTSDTMNRYVARLKLPVRLSPGGYRVSVSRDGRSWVEIADQVLEVRPDASTPKQYAASDSQFGGCKPDDGRDDTACILRAIDAAKRAGGGIVYFGPGTWDLINSAPQPGLLANEGILVPDGVSLQGAGSELTRIDRHPEWNQRAPNRAFTLIGHTVISGLSLRDLKVYGPQDNGGPFLQLGESYEKLATATKSAPVLSSVDEVVITRNRFDKTFIAVADAGLPISRLIITDNEFGAYYEALSLAGNRYNIAIPFRIDDSVIDNNVFKPGSYLDIVRKTGSIASELGAGRRVDFSGNIADGSSSDYLYRPDDARGWRAAFFWSMNNNVEALLLSRNRATCTGDKIGDGEAISFDNNANTFALASISEIAHAAPSSVTVSAPLVTRQNSRDAPVGSYYLGHWIQIASGPGLGQVRKISGYTFDPKTRTTTFNISPHWDVSPVPGKTRLAIGREYWQVYTIDNEIDHRQPLCLKSNRSRHDGGGIVLWAQSADSVIEGNRQYDSDGILLQENYELPEKPCQDCNMQSFFQYFLEIRKNIIDGEYAWDTDCSASGITAGIAAVPWDDPTPPTVGYGVSIAHNVIRRADAAHGGAIAQMSSWYAGPEPHRWALSNNMLIHHNSIRDIDGQAALGICGAGQPRIGINFPLPDIVWRTVLYANTCENVSQTISTHSGVDTTRVCPSGAPSSCECRIGER